MPCLEMTKGDLMRKTSWGKNLFFTGQPGPVYIPTDIGLPKLPLLLLCQPKLCFVSQNCALLSTPQCFVIQTVLLVSAPQLLRHPDCAFCKCSTITSSSDCALPGAPLSACHPNCTLLVSAPQLHSGMFQGGNPFWSCGVICSTCGACLRRNDKMAKWCFGMIRQQGK
jgi:hypothetical protein